jgi:hypothetical protein
VEESVRDGRRLFSVIRRGDSLEAGALPAVAAQNPRTAALAAAMLPASATPNHLDLSDRSNACGHPLHEGRQYLAHVAPEIVARAPHLLHHLHAARHLTANLDSLTLLLVALDPETLEALGRALARRPAALH